MRATENYTKLDHNQVLELLRSGESLAGVARKLGVPYQIIQYIRNKHAPKATEPKVTAKPKLYTRPVITDPDIIRVRKYSSWSDYT